MPRYTESTRPNGFDQPKPPAQETETALPPQLEFIKQEKLRVEFFRILGEIERELVPPGSIPAYLPLELRPKPNLCGYVATAIAEGMRARQLKSRVVYGHGTKDGETVYHYWAEAKIENTGNFEVDGTYGQFDKNLDEKILVYPAVDLPNYALKEYKENEKPFLPTDEGTAKFLNSNDGLLPMRDHIKNRKILALYKRLVEIFSTDIWQPSDNAR